MLQLDKRQRYKNKNSLKTLGKTKFVNYRCLSEAPTSGVHILYVPREGGLKSTLCLHEKSTGEV